MLADAFKGEHYPILLNDLSRVAHKWVSIAIQLGFSYDEIENIRGKLTLAVQGSQGYLREVIGLWLKRDAPNHPTLSALIQALNSESVAEVILSNSLEEQYQGLF